MEAEREQGLTGKETDAEAEFAVVDEDAGDEENEPMEVTEEGKKEDEEGVLMKNPLFGKETVPVIDIEDSDDSASSEEEDFSEDVDVDNFKPPLVTNGEEGSEGIKSGEGRAPLAQCTTDCYKEKGILVEEIERLRRAVFELNERHSVMEDFIEVEYGDRFEKFLKKREHLVSMGFGGKDSEGSGDIIDGKRSAKSAELVELLKMIKNQTNSNDENGCGDRPSSEKPSSSSTAPKSGSATKPVKNQQKSKGKSIPSLMSQRTHPPSRGDGRGGALSYNQSPILVPNTAAVAYQFQQQQLLAQRAYYEQMYAGGLQNSRDIVTNVMRRPLGPPSGPSSGAPRDSKKERKRKRQSEQSSETSSARKPSSSDPDIQIIAEKSNPSMDTSAKRICPLCEKIFPKKSLRDHLTVVHQGLKVACTICQAEFMQRRKLKLHMKDDHDMPLSEYTEVINKIYADIEEQCGPWLYKIIQEAEPPTKDQLLLHNAQLQMEILSKKDGTGGGAPTETATKPAPVKQAPKQQSSRAPRRPPPQQRPSQYAQQSQPVRYFTGANARVSGGRQSGGYTQASNDLYGPGGYAQFAQRYLQQRAAGGGGYY